MTVDNEAVDEVVPTERGSGTDDDDVIDWDVGCVRAPWRSPMLRVSAPACRRRKCVHGTGVYSTKQRWTRCSA